MITTAAIGHGTRGSITGMIDSQYSVLLLRPLVDRPGGTWSVRDTRLVASPTELSRIPGLVQRAYSVSAVVSRVGMSPETPDFGDSTLPKNDGSDQRDPMPQHNFFGGRLQLHFGPTAEEIGKAHS
jgi:hypothetical protein